MQDEEQVDLKADYFSRNHVVLHSIKNSHRTPNWQGPPVVSANHHEAQQAHGLFDNKCIFRLIPSMQHDTFSTFQLPLISQNSEYLDAIQTTEEWRGMLEKYAATFDPCTFEWKLVQPMGLLNVCPTASNPTCGKILSRCKNQISCFKTKIGNGICVFKIGVSANPVMRYISFVELGFTSMWVLEVSPSIGLIHMLEAALISEYASHVGCRNKEGSGGEGKAGQSKGPYFVYVTGGRADQPRRVG